MRPRILFVGLGVIAAVSWSGLLIGCGGDDDTSSTAAATSDEASAESEESEADEESAATTTSTAGSQTLTIEMGEFYYKPDAAEAKAGAVTIDAPNVGKEPHELVLAKTDDDPADLPTGSDGGVDEESLDVPGEVAEVEAGGDGSVTLDLEPGNYVMFCNLPGHYASGMYGSLTVK